MSEAVREPGEMQGSESWVADGAENGGQLCVTQAPGRDVWDHRRPSPLLVRRKGKA